MIIDLIELITFIALVLYVVFAGADYGAGILELFRRKDLSGKIEVLVTRTIGPVWEANHIWLILIIVILFNGFPLLYSTISTYLHVPLVAVLIGIVFRGVAFTFRHYDLFPGKPTRLYTILFAGSSFWTSCWLGILAGALLLGRMTNAPEATVYTLYYAPWMNSFCFSVGLFVTSVFTYVASAFLIGETDDPELKKYFKKFSFYTNVAVLLAGGLVFFAAQLHGLKFFSRFLNNQAALLMIFLATLLWVLQLIKEMKSFWTSRFLVIGQVVFILLGLLFIQAPTVIVIDKGVLTFSNTAAPEATLIQLLLALIVGLIFILPSFGYLFWVFKFKKSKAAITE